MKDHLIIMDVALCGMREKERKRERENGTKFVCEIVGTRCVHVLCECVSACGFIGV